MADLEIEKLSDEEIVGLILKKKNPALFEIIYERYSNVVFNKCLSFVHEHILAEDLTHDILVKVYLKLNSFSGKSKFSTWLYAITYNACVDFHSKQSKTAYQKEKYVEDKVAFEWLETDDEDLHSIQMSRLKIILEQIPDEERVALLLKYQDDLSIKEICVVTNLSESAIKMRLKRGRDRIIMVYQDKYAHNVM